MSRVNKFACPPPIVSRVLTGIRIFDFVKYSTFSGPSYLNYRKVPLRQFNTNFEIDSFSFDYTDGLKWLLGNFSTNNATKIISTMNSVTDDGTWSAADNATNIQTETANYITGSGAIEVDMSAGGTVLSIVNSTLTAVDLTSVNKLFFWVFLPSTDYPTSITLRYGSSANDYYASSTTTPFNVASFNQGWNLVSFETGTASGSPDIENIDYVKISMTFLTAPTK